MKYFRFITLCVVNLVVFMLLWVSLGSLAETVIHKHMNDTITLPLAFSWGAINFLISRGVAVGLEYLVEWVVWGKPE